MSRGRNDFASDEVRADSMTKKRLYQQHSSLPTQSQSIPLRQADNHAGHHFSPANNHESHDKQAVARPPKRLLETETLSDDADEPAFAVSVDPNIRQSEVACPTSVEGTSQVDAHSPSSVFTPPSESSIAHSPWSPSSHPHRKKARTESSTEQRHNIEETSKINRFDIADILNPSSQDHVRQSPSSSRGPDVDHFQPLVAAVAAVLEKEATPPTNQVRIPSSGNPRFPEIRPRPPGFNDFPITRSPIVPEADQQSRQKKKGRKGAFKTDEERAEIFAVREMGACLRCAIMRIKCEPVKDEACANCRETLPKSRKWMVPCTRVRLKERWQYTMPQFVRDHHDPKKTLPRIEPEHLYPFFKLNLTHVAEFSIDIEVCEVKSTGLPEKYYEAYFRKYDFTISGDPQDLKVEMSEASNLPLVPNFKFGPDSYKHAVRQVKVLMEKEMNKARWQAEALPVETGQPWAREVLLMIIHFRGEIGGCKALELALKCCEVRFLMNHPFHIKFEDMPSVNTQLTPTWRITWDEIQRRTREIDLWSPKHVNRWLKTAVMEMMRYYLPKLFESLENNFKLLDNRGDEAKLSEIDRDETFCAIVASFVVFGTTQKKLLQSAMAWEKDADYEGEPGALVSEAKQCITLIETEVIDHILQLWKYRFFRQNMKGQPHANQLDAARRAQNFGGGGVNVIADFERLSRKPEYALTLSDTKLELDLSDSGRKQFMSSNVTRLLLRLSRAIWRPRSQRPRG